MIFDLKVKDLGYGNFDIEVPVKKVVGIKELLEQQVLLILATYKGDFLYDTRLGVDYFNFLSKKFDKTLVQTEFFNAISSLIYFKRFDKFDVIIDNGNREMQVDMVIIAEDGQEISINIGI